MKASIYNQLSSLIKSYFETNSQYFLDDLIEQHLNIRPEHIKADGLKSILDWLDIAASLLINDQQSANSFMIKVRALAEDSRK